MRIQDLISIGCKYLTAGLAAALVTAGAALIIYMIFPKRKKSGMGKILWWGIFICYLTVVLGVTLVDRQGFWQNKSIMPLFYSYRDAWVDFSRTSWRNIILNILMFVPLGFLLPLGTDKLDNFIKTTLVGFALTSFIEVCQLVLKLGIFEPDDLLNNTVGTMIGYGLFALLACMRKKKTLKKAIIAQIPLVITAIVFGAVFGTYIMKDIGNVEGQYIVKCDAEVLSETDYSDERGSLPVYKSRVLSKNDTVKFAKAFFENIGSELDESSNDFYGGTAVFKAVDRYSLWINYVGGSYNFTDFETSFPKNELKAVENADENEIRAALLLYGIDVDKEARFENLGSGRYSFTAQTGSVIGSLQCEYYENGCFSNIKNDLVNCEIYRDFDIISEQDAFQMIKDGKFRYYGDENPKVIVGKCRIDYAIDSKGYYQPVYVFDCDVNSNQETIVIAAIK